MKMAIWIIGCMVFIFLHLVGKIVLMCVWHKAKDPKELEAKINLFGKLVVFITEVACYTYGSIFLCNRETQACVDQEDSKIITVLYMTAIGL